MADVIDSLHVKSTSRASADCSDNVLRETNTTRLVFRPMLVENQAKPEACVKGTFIFQRKGQKDEWGDTETISLSSLKKDEGFKLEIKSMELLKLFKGIHGLYQLHSKSGIPFGETEFVPVSTQLAQLENVSPDELERILAANAAVGPGLLVKLLGWATDGEDPAALVERLLELAPENLRKLNVAVGLQSLKGALSLWRENENSSDEEFWQRALTDNSFVLEHVFSWPTTILKGKAYVGGKSILNTGGNIVDFLVQNRITRNAALVEIKTPGTAILGKRYRDNIYNPSDDLSGAVMQVLNYKHSLQDEYQSLTHGQGNLFKSFDPRCIVILGNAQTQLLEHDKRKSFELLRGQLADVDVITFDELFEKTQQLINVLESPANIESEFDDDIPF